MHDLIEPEPTETVVEPQIPQPAPKPPPAPLPISLRNGKAVRVSISVAALLSVLQSIPLPALLQLLWLAILLPAGGFAAVYMYARRTGEELSAAAGARLGWITGLFVFLISLVLFTISMLLIASSGGVQEFLRKNAGRSGAADTLSQVDALLSSPAGTATLVLGSLFMLFFLLTILASVGGAVAAKVLQKD